MTGDLIQRVEGFLIHPCDGHHPDTVQLCPVTESVVGQLPEETFALKDISHRRIGLVDDNLFYCNKLPFSGCKMLGRPFAEFQAVQRFHAVSSGRDHAFDLVVFAFGNRQQRCVRIFQHGFGSLHGFIVVMEQYAVFQALAESFVGGMFQADAVELGRFVFGRGHTVVELATTRSEERRVGKECRSRWSPYH